jgi:hypothetical protein
MVETKSRSELDSVTISSKGRSPEAQAVVDAIVDRRKELAA